MKLATVHSFAQLRYMVKRDNRYHEAVTAAAVNLGSKENPTPTEAMEWLAVCIADTADETEVVEEINACILDLNRGGSGTPTKG